MSDDVPLESRTGTSGLWGKLDAELPKQRISLETLVALQRKAAEAHLTLAEYIRTLLDVHAHGFEEVVTLKKRRLREVVGQDAEKAFEHVASLAGQRPLQVVGKGDAS